MERLHRLAHLATAAPFREREQIARIIRISKEADDTAQKTMETMKRIMNKPGSHT
ncbi:hypothetical protein GGE65_007658 [Skermanella aerolata]|uniref:hypothetical protein n=1 Tax=Skermanella aerolata TaxID=393310 RepID=UPI003D1D550F